MALGTGETGQAQPDHSGSYPARRAVGLVNPAGDPSMGTPQGSLNRGATALGNVKRRGE